MWGECRQDWSLALTSPSVCGFTERHPSFPFVPLPIWMPSLHRLFHHHFNRGRGSYAFKPWIPGSTHTTGALVLVALTAAFGTLAFFNLLHSIRDLRSGLGSFLLTVSWAMMR